MSSPAYIGSLYDRWIGFSNDTKPTASVKTGSLFDELDSGRRFIFGPDGTWYEDFMSKVLVEDISTEDIDYHLLNELGTASIAVSTTIEDRIITLGAGHGASAGEYLNIAEGVRFYQGTVLVVDGNDITLDSGLDFAFTTAAAVVRGTENLAVDGSVTPVVFKIAPPGTLIWHINRFIFHIEDNVDMDTGKFGGIAALTNGMLLRKKNDSFKNFFNIKSNGDFTHRSYDVQYDAKAPAGVYGFSCRSTYNGEDKRGVTIELIGSQNDEVQAIIQDDLTDLTSFHIIAQGHRKVIYD